MRVGCKRKGVRMGVSKQTIDFYNQRLTRDWLKEEYCRKGKSINRIAKETGIGRNFISKRMEGLNIKKLSQSEAASKHNKEIWADPEIREKRKIVSGKDHPMYRDGRIKTADGYIYVVCRDHPYKIKNGRVFEHRLVMEKKIGRYLKPEEVVHHINEDKSDNRIENLFLFKDDRNHHHFHHEFNKDPKAEMKYEYPESELWKLTDNDYKTAMENGLDKSTVYERVKKGWTVEDSITRPFNQRPTPYREWLDRAIKNGIKPKTFAARRKRGWSLEEACTKPTRVRI